MIDRNIHTDDVLDTITHGELLKAYTDDKPYPSFLLLKFVNNRPLHVVMAYNKVDENCIIVTCYEPDAALWDEEFRNKMK